MDLFGLNWDKLHQELSADLSGIVDKVRGTGGDPLARVQTTGMNSDPLARVNIGGASSDPLGRVRLGGASSDPLSRVSLGGSQPFSFLPQSSHDDPFWRLPASMGQAGADRTVTTTSSTSAFPASGTTDTNYVASAADNAGITGQQVDAYITATRNTSPLQGKGQYILDMANKYGVSVPQMLGIMLKETELGVTAGANKNLTGIVAPTDGGLGTTRQFNGYQTWEQSIEATAANLATPTYKGKPLAEQIGNWYVGPQAYAAGGLNATDQAGNGTVGDYLNTVAQVYAYFGKPLGTGGTGQAGDLIAKAKTLAGTPYQSGGYRTHRNDPRLGIDCSEYTAWIYNGSGVQLPENAQMQYNSTQRVDQAQLQPGDLVFFQGTYDVGNGEVITHVGMYIGDGQMINAQTGGVMVANLNDPYWQQHYAGAGRVARTPVANSTPR